MTRRRTLLGFYGDRGTSDPDDVSVPDVLVPVGAVDVVIASFPVPENCALEVHGLQYLAADGSDRVDALIPLAKCIRVGAAAPTNNAIVNVTFAAGFLFGLQPTTRIVADATSPTGWYLQIIQDGQNVEGGDDMLIASRYCVSALPLNF